jgi:chaperonin cofactor prefoldin
MSMNKQAIDELTKVLDRIQFKRDRLREQLRDIESQYETISGALRVLGHTSDGHRRAIIIVWAQLLSIYAR